MRSLQTKCARRAARAVMIAALGFACAGNAAAGAAAPIDLRDAPLLFVDNAPIAAQSGVVRTLHPARTSPTPVI
ncbi:MAG: hypothetical protein Q7R41_13875, partial [Phycisphaerales bacterium]|nr:hypothetical protein [Phycisphaerales bacterium]